MSGATDLRRKAGMYKRMAAVRTSGGHEADRQLLTLADKLDHEAARLEGQTEPPRGANGDPAPHIAGHGRASALRRQPAARCSRCAAYLAEFERSMIVERVRSGIAKTRATGTRSGKPIGRPAVPPEKIAAIRSALAAGDGIRKVARLIGVGNETVHKIAREMRAAA
jgi:hypothetical protein